MYNLHCHSLLSDGVLLPSEVAVRYAAAGYKVIAITDHADYSTIKTTIVAIIEFCRHWPQETGITVLPGIELTHLPLTQFKPLTRYARKKGIQIIVAHGETTMEPVIPGTNRAALEADIDILAHPGMIIDEDALLAKKRGIFLEITSRSGHATTNKHVCDTAMRLGVRLILNNDSHTPEDIISPDALTAVGRAQGLNDENIKEMYRTLRETLAQKGVR